MTDQKLQTEDDWCAEKVKELQATRNELIRKLQSNIRCISDFQDDSEMTSAKCHLILSVEFTQSNGVTRNPKHALERRVIL